MDFMIDISPSSDRIVLIGHDKEEVHFWDLLQKKEIWSFHFDRGAGGHITAGFLNDNQAYVAADQIAILDVNNKRELRRFPQARYKQSVFSSALSSDKKLLAIGDLNELLIWELESGEKTASLSGFQGEIIGVAFLPNTNEIIVMDRYTLSLWDYKSKKELRKITIQEMELKMSANDKSINSEFPSRSLS
jgi:WD40 repeat protein